MRVVKTAGTRDSGDANTGHKITSYCRDKSEEGWLLWYSRERGAR